MYNILFSFVFKLISVLNTVRDKNLCFVLLQIKMENSDEDDFPLTEDQMDKLAQLQVCFFCLVKI